MFSKRVLGVAAAAALVSSTAWAHKVSIEAEVSTAGKSQAAEGDKAFAAGDLRTAAAAYGEGYADTKEPEFLFALAKVQQAMKNQADAKLLFETYLAAGQDLKHKAEAEAATGKKTASQGGKGLLGAATGTVGGVVNAATNITGNLLANIKVGISNQVDAAAKSSAEAGDKAYNSGNWNEAEKNYDAAYEKSQQAASLFAEGMADAQGGDAAEARSELAGYLATGPKGEQAEAAKRAFLAMGGNMKDIVGKLNVAAKASKEVKSEAQKGDQAYNAGRFLDAAKIYGEAYAKKSDAVLLYGKGMAQYYEGDVKDAAATLKQYLSSGGNLDHKMQAEATLKASGSAN